MSLMVSDRVAFFPLIYFLCTLMGCWKGWQIVMLVVFGVHCLWVLWPMQMVLAPCASALRCMLNIYNTYAFQHWLWFNAGKTLLICFRKSKSIKSLPVIHFQNTHLKYKHKVNHLGHILHYNLDDGPDITRAIKDLNKKACSID